MEVKKCAVNVCNNCKYLCTDVTYHRFPSDFIKARTWAIAINRKDLLKKSEAELKEYIICSNHFTKEMFILVDPDKIHLKNKAIPTENLIELDELSLPDTTKNIRNETICILESNDPDDLPYYSREDIVDIQECASPIMSAHHMSENTESDIDDDLNDNGSATDELIKKLPPISPAFAKLLQTTKRKTGRGRQYCCVPRCKNTYLRNPGIKFYRFPADSKVTNEKRKQWIAAVKTQMAKYTLWGPTENSRICSAHFVGGLKSQDPLSPSFVPSIFPPKFARPITLIEKRRSQQYTAKTNDMSCQVDLETANIGSIIEETSFTVCVMSHTATTRNVEVQMETTYDYIVDNTSDETCIVKSEVLSESESSNYVHIQWE